MNYDRDTTNPRANPLGTPSGAPERTTTSIELQGESNKGASAPTLLDSRGEPMREAKRLMETTSEEEIDMELEGAERGTSRVGEVIEDINEGVMDVAQSASEAASDAAEGASKIAGDARQGAKQVARTAQRAAGHALESGQEVLEDLKEGAIEIADTARAAAGAATEGLKETAQEVGGKIRHAKDRALHSASSAIHQVGPTMRRANRATGAFVASNAVPMSLLGFGAGRILMSARRNRSASRVGPQVPGAIATAATQPDSAGSGNGKSEVLKEAAKIIEAVPERMHDAAASAGEEIKHVAAGARDRAADLTHRAVHSAEKARDAVSERATKVKKQAAVQVDRAKVATHHLAESQPLVLLALSLGAGVGTAVALPASKPEKRLMGGTRDRVIDQASAAASSVGQVARKAAQDLQRNVSP